MNNIYETAAGFNRVCNKLLVWFYTDKIHNLGIITNLFIQHMLMENNTCIAYYIQTIYILGLEIYKYFCIYVCMTSVA